MVKGGLFSKDKTGEDAREFMTRFKAQNGTFICREPLQRDISTSEGLKPAKREKHFKKRGPWIVRDAAEILEKLLKD